MGELGKSIYFPPVDMIIWWQSGWFDVGRESIGSGSSTSSSSPALATMPTSKMAPPPFYSR